MLDPKRPLSCKTEGCGHLLEHHVVVPSLRCRVTGCQCDKWRVSPDPIEEPPQMPEDWQDRVLGWVRDGNVVVIFGGMSTAELRLELIGAGLDPLGSRVRTIEPLPKEDPDA